MADHFVVRVYTYYRDVDRGDVDRIIDLFAPEATYRRGQSFLLEGRDAIAAFYTDVRKLVGTHTLHEVRGEGDEVWVRGTFTGTHDGQPVEIQWSDRWVFDDRGLVRLRESELDHDGM